MHTSHTKPPATLSRALPILLSILLALLILPTACRPRPAAQAQATYRVTVVEGSGGGDFAPGETVRIEPFRMPDTQVFGGWEGLTAELGDAPVAHATFVMPDRALALKAIWQAAPLWAWQPVPGFEAAAMAHAPRLPPGQQGDPAILVLLHDAGRDQRYWQQSTEARLFARAAAARGMGLIAVASTDPEGHWDLERGTIADNPDLGRLLGALHAAGFVGPLVFVGVGEGAAFADLAARAFLPLSSVQGSAAVLVGGAGHAEPDQDLPRMWVLADKDAAEVKDEAARRHAALLRAGLPTALVALPPWPIFPRRFWRVEGLTAGDSIQLHTWLTDNGVIDARGTVLLDPAGPPLDRLPEDFRAAAPNIVEQLNAGWGGHGFNSHAAEAVLDFAERFGRVASSVPTPTPTRRAYLGGVRVSGGAAGKGDFGKSDRWYADLDRVHLWAEPDPPGLVFDHWSGDVATLDDPRARHSVFTVRSTFTELAANFAPAPTWRPVMRSMDGRDLYFHTPPDPVGIVFFFHGAGGASRGWVEPGNAENWQALRDAVARGYAVAVTESGDRQARQWSTVDPPEANPDIQHVRAFHASLVAEGVLAADLPIFGIGMSNGGGFVSRVADALGWQGAVVYDAGCRARLAATTRVPIAWHLSHNDRRVSNQDAFACYDLLRRRDIPTELRILAPQPVHPMRLRRGPAVGPAEAEQVQQALATAGLLDRVDYLIQPPSTSAWRAALAGIPGVPAGQIADQLDVCWTEHQLFADFDHWALDFFDRQRGVASTPTPRAVVTLTPESSSEPPTTSTPTVEIEGSATPKATGTAAPRPGRAIFLPMAVVPGG